MNFRNIIFLIFTFSFLTAAAQDTIPQKAGSGKPIILSLELGGPGGLYSINYERIAHLLTSRSTLYWSGGFSIVPTGSRTIFDIPLSLIYWDVRGLEVGTGQTVIISTGGKGGTIRGTFRLGYRRNHWRIAYTPFYSYLNNFQWEHWFGIGYRFGIKEKK